MAYKLRCSMHGHSSDVRGVGASGQFVASGSRDMTCKLWTPDDNRSFQETRCFRSHTNFVSAVCVVAPNDFWKDGLVLTASSDKSICAFNFQSQEPLFRLTGHSSTVCSLAVGKFGTIVSGSWDDTAKVWLNMKCVMTLEGHAGSVWAVAIMSQSGLTLTGSADKTIKLWRAGHCSTTFSGHTDCVRGLTVVSEVSFLSCSNDSTIRKWLITGQCEAVFEGHESFVYSVAGLSSLASFVSVGEDRSLRVWKEGKCEQVITLPAQSVWSVAVLENDDVVTGSSDGVVRIFTANPAKYAPVEELKALEEEVANSTVTTGEIGDLKINELPGKEVLYQPGQRDGQTKLVREGSKVGVYQWTESESKWMKIGDAVGSADASPSSSKVQYEGKEYDYVFEVDIEEGRPPLKLPYNVTEDPWFAAQTFLEKNDISQLYLDQVANFIMKNSKGMALTSPGANYEDPFTGQSRYKPGSTPAVQLGSKGSTDPFTGSGRYIPSNSPSTAPPTRTTNAYFPQKEILTFAAAKLDGIRGKLLEFSQHSELGDERPSEDVIDSILELINKSSDCKAEHLRILESWLHWPETILFPVLDVFRLVIRNNVIHERFCGGLSGQAFIRLIISYVKRCDANSTTNCILSLKILCNMSSYELGRQLVLQYRGDVIASILALTPCSAKQAQIAFSTVLLNYSVLLTGCSDPEAGCECITAITYLLQNELDNEAYFRLLVAAGTILHHNSESVVIARSLDLHALLSHFEMIEEPKKVGQCAREIAKILN